MKKYLLPFILILTGPISVFAQFERLLIEEKAKTENGTTYQISVLLKNSGDRLMAVFGDSSSVLIIESSERFYQNRYGSGLSTGVRRSLLEVRDSLKYDSWLTIGREDNYDNKLKALGLNLDDFENHGGAIVCTDGAWYCLPVDEQSLCGEDKKILILQLTTKGVISGNLSLMGRTAGGENFEVRSIQFSTAD